MWLFSPKKLFFSLFTTFFCKSTMKIFSACIAGGNGRVKVGVLLQSSVEAVTLSEDMFLLPFCCFLSEIVCFFVIFTHLYTQFFFFVVFCRVFQMLFPQYCFCICLWIIPFCYFFRVFQNDLSAIFLYLLRFCFYSWKSALLLALFITGKFCKRFF